jgi:hypothetical protein
MYVSIAKHMPRLHMHVVLHSVLIYSVIFRFRHMKKPGTRMRTGSCGDGGN